MPFSLSRGVRTSVRKFCQLTSFGGYNYLMYPRKTDKILWFCVHVIILSLTLLTMTTLWSLYLENPTVTSLESTIYPITQIPFPGVGVCNINKISKKEAEAFAKFVSSLTKIDADLILKYSKLLGNLYEFEVEYSDDLDDFQSILDGFSDERFQIRNIMKLLTTPCERLLYDCRWKGAPVNCSTIFEMRLTYEGYCCTFNYFKKTDDLEGDEIAPGLEYGQWGIENGLQFHINNEIEDYFYTSLSSTGVKIITFSPTDYPDKNSGGLSAQLVAIGTEALLEIKPTTIYATSSVINYPLDKRLCTFDVEEQTTFGPYSQSDCLMDCRIDSMKTLCGCLPFMIPAEEDEPVCTLSDLPCLERYKSKWNAVLPSKQRVDRESFAMEEQHSLRCTCHPACSTTSYSIFFDSIPIRDANSKVASNRSMVTMYFRTRYSNIYVQDVVYYWFEIFSNFGGAFGLTAGFSLVVVVEVLYFTLKIFVYGQPKIRKRRRVS